MAGKMFYGGPGGIRTPVEQIRSLLPNPLGYGAKSQEPEEGFEPP